MKLSSTIWRCIILLLTFSIKFFPLLPACCQRSVTCGNLTVEPAPLFLLGSNLTIYCHIKKYACNPSSTISLALNGKTVDKWKRVNCPTTVFHLPRLWMPRFSLVCWLKTDEHPRLVSGLDLKAGLPPDKPGNITCETTRRSDLINCSWTRGQETYVSTFYNISISRENGTQIHLYQIQDADSITIPRAILDENTKYMLIITASNHFGVSQSDPFDLCEKDIVIPESPHIIQVVFQNNSMAAVLQWTTTELSVHLRPHVSLRTNNTFWEVREGAELSEGLVRVDNLRPLTEYEFQIRICKSAFELTGTSTTSCTTTNTSRCSKWSPSVRRRSPGKGPSQQLRVWRKLDTQGTNGQWTVTVLWQPLPPEDFSGKVQQYEIFLDNAQKLKICDAVYNHSIVQVPEDVYSLSVFAVTSYGKSPPADVILRQSGISGPVLGELSPAANGNAVLISWSWLEEELQYYVIEWRSIPAARLQWQQLAKELKNTSITGLTPGVRYNVSLYAVTTRGVSAPSSRLVYSREQKPLSGPSLSVLVRKSRRILVQWDELPIDQQRGFISKYTIYFQTLGSKNKELNETVAGSGPRQMWLDCPEGTLVLHMTASNSAGEGPHGRKISSQPVARAVGVVIVIVFFITLFIGIIANLMCWSCVRKRIKQKCISWGPAWLGEKLPKPGHSNAIRLLENEEIETLFSSTQSDPPLSPITVISQEEKDEVYSNIHVEESQTGSGQLTVEAPLLMSDIGKMFVNIRLGHVGYKPQTGRLASQGKEENEAEEMQRDSLSKEEEDRSSSVLEGLLSDLLLNVDFSESSRGLTDVFVSHPLWPETAEMNVSNGGLQFFQEKRGNEEGVETDCPSLDLQQDGIMTPDTADTSLSQCTGEMILNGGYFPQVAAVNTNKQ